MKKILVVTLVAILCGGLLFLACGGGSSSGGNGPGTGPGGPIETGVGEEGVWDWSTSDDQKANQAVNNVSLKKPPYKTVATKSFPQSNFGGASTISGQPDTVDPAIQRPGPAGADGKTEATAFKFSGTVKVSKDNRGKDEGMRFPFVGWEAVPDDATLEKLREAWAYSFYIKINSTSVKSTATANPDTKNFVMKTCVGQEGLALDQGHEYKHYFGNYIPTAAEPYAGSRDHFTEIEAGEWTKITVVLDPDKEDEDGNKLFNIEQDNYIHQYNNEWMATFDKSTVTKIQWQISLQDQKGITQRNGDPYDMPNGYFDYDIELYGLELYLEEDE